MSYLDGFRQELKKLLSCLKSAPSFLSKSNVWCKTKVLKSWTKCALLRRFWAVILKNCCRIWHQHSQICQNAKLGIGH